MSVMEKGIFKIEILQPHEISRALDFYAACGHAYLDTDRQTLVESMESGLWAMIMASDHGEDIGGCYLNWDPKYRLYQRMGLPEIQDLRVLPLYRRRGAGAALIEAAEQLAKGGGRDGIGLSVGLNAHFGAAQRLYIRLGYMPDGQGVTYMREPVAAGEKRPIDDDLALMLLKHF
jgi:GNAT superfamily N-acetyltransferase